MIAVAVVLALVLLLWLRRKAKRSLVAGLDRPAIWREPVPGRIRTRGGDRL